MNLAKILKLLASLFILFFIIYGVQCNFKNSNLEKSNSSTVQEESIPTKENCKLKPDRGPCRAMMKGYFFNPTTKTCQEFIYGGCGGSLPFKSKEDCERLCK